MRRSCAMSTLLGGGQVCALWTRRTVASLAIVRWRNGVKPVIPHPTRTAADSVRPGFGDNRGMNESQPEPEKPEPQQDQTPSPQRRLQQLRAIPERDRTDAEWDEMNELEIMLASSNRAGAPD